MKQTYSSPATHRVTQVLFGLRNRHFLALDLLAFCLTPIIALWLRLDSLDTLLRYIEPLALYALVAILLRCSVFIAFGIYSRYWRYASIDELAQITLAVVIATLIIVFVFFGLLRPFDLIPDDLPRSIPFIDGILALLVVGGLRYSVRLTERVEQRSRHPSDKKKRVAIFGAGDSGAMIVKELRANPQLGLEPVAFLDDDPRKYKMIIHGVPVVGGRQLIRQVLDDYRIQQAIIAMPTASGKTIRELDALCREANLPVKTVPGMYELLSGNVTVDKLRAVDITDLLRREPIVTNTARVSHLVSGKGVLITGAGGSIGSELCRQIAHRHPANLILLGHGENSLFQIANDLRHAYPQLTFEVVVADVRDERRIRHIFERYQPQVVFHAAAHKHVPLMEANVEDAVTNNVLGTRNLVEAAIQSGTERFVLISTDKAVNPTSVMGATKRVAEIIVHTAAVQTGRCFVAVRFGNVLGSRGSVVPLFKQQIARGGPVTVTHPEVRRYFMTIPEAVQLVLQAAALGEGGEIFALDMGESVKILELARDLIRLSGLEEGRDIDIVYTGLGPGEKLYEELLVAEEVYVRTEQDKIYAFRNGNESTVSQSSRLELASVVNALIACAQAGDSTQIRQMLQKIVPEYQGPEIDFNRIAHAGSLANAPNPSSLIKTPVELFRVDAVNKPTIDSPQ